MLKIHAPASQTAATAALPTAKLKLANFSAERPVLSIKQNERPDWNGKFTGGSWPGAVKQQPASNAQQD
jgi:hypothetical protein